MGPEAEFFLFDDVRFSNTINKVSYEVDANRRLLEHRCTEYEMGNTGHRPGVKGGYFPVNPIDECTRHPFGNALDHEASGHES